MSRDGHEAADPTLSRRKSFWLENYRPYRKPYRYAGERILRCAGEPSLRNSAKFARNFGIRVAPVVKSEQTEHEAVAEKRPKRLFTTNTGAC